MPFEKSQSHINDLGYLLAEAPKNVVFVTGAGLSAPAQIPMWQQLCDTLKKAAIDFLSKRLEDAPDELKERIRELNELIDLWFLGDLLEETLPAKKFQEIVQKELEGDHVPPIYKAIWDLNISGVINFNLDRCAEYALAGTVEQVATSIDSAKYKRFLLLTRQFLFQPHGRVDRPNTWVLGAKSRNKLLKNPSYRDFLKHLLGSRRLVIVGFRPSDLSFQVPLLDDFREVLQDGPGHFWITSALNGEQRRFAALHNLHPIEYTASTSRHEEVSQIISYLGEFRPRIPRAPLAYKGEAISPDELPSEEMLRAEPVESIRSKLNAALKGALTVAGNDPTEQLRAIQDLLSRYSGSVKIAWHITQEPPYNRILGYKIIEKLGHGAFSNVWKVTDQVDGMQYALKIMRDEITGSVGMYEAFRRGVAAMRILDSHAVKGMVKFIGAYDVPAAVVMEYVPGMTLEEALSGHMIETIGDALQIVKETSEIVRGGHELRDRVLHRDLKPSNVMLRFGDPSSTSAGFEVVVLDFDLSWYEGALGRSALLGQRLHNYLAPEQVTRASKEVSSRHTAVDVFGIGMLLYYCATAEDPPLNAQKLPGFTADIRAKTRGRWRVKFNSTIPFLARLIQLATADDQKERISLPGFLDGLDLLKRAEIDGIMDVPSDLAVTELGSALEVDENWSIQDLGVASGCFHAVSRISGAHVEIKIPGNDLSDGGGHEELLKVLIYTSDSGIMERSSRGKYIREKTNQAAGCLRRGDIFQGISANSELGSAAVEASIRSGRWTPVEARQASEQLAEAANILAFSK